MAAVIDSFDALNLAVVDQLDRPDLSNEVAGWIALAESRFNGALRAREMEVQAAIGSEAASAPLPDDFLEWIALDWSGRGRVAHPSFVETNSPEARFKHRPNGDPQYFVVSAGQVRVVPGKPGDLTLTYYAKITPLGTETPDNWLLRRAPDAYLYAAVAEAYIFIKAPDQAQAHLQLALGALQAAGLSADNQKLSRRPARDAEVNASAQAAARGQ